MVVVPAGGVEAAAVIVVPAPLVDPALLAFPRDSMGEFLRMLEYVISLSAKNTKGRDIINAGIIE